MRVSMLALGSRGDVQPIVALGHGLRLRGHTVRMATFENFGTLVTAYGLEFLPVRGNAKDILESAGGQALAEAGQNVWRSMSAIMASFGKMKQAFHDGFRAPALWDCDVVICQLPGAVYARDACEVLGIPLVSAAVIPMGRTHSLQNLFFPAAPVRLPGYNALTHRLAEWMLWLAFRDAINDWRRQVWGLKTNSYSEHFGWLQHNAVNLYGFSSQVVPRPPDWGPNTHLTGYWRLPKSDSQPSQALLDFLTDGTPPVMIGFGSMPIRKKADTVEIVITAARAAGYRLLLHAGWAGLGFSHAQSGPDTFSIDDADYAWLFPQLAAIVHHGGSGTTGAALSSGTPSLVIPFGADQFYWGQRTADLGAGPRPIPFQQLTSRRLTDALVEMRDNANLRSVAGKLGFALRGEDGIRDSVAIIESL